MIPSPDGHLRSPFAPFFDAQGVVVLDGGLATTLESYGHDLHDALWSARVLLEEPESVRRAHVEFLEAGADCIATVTYQATYEGLMDRGMSRAEADAVFRRAVSLAVEARDDFWSVPANREGRLRPLVAASIGPYGAFLADGSEYTGAYGLSQQELRDFHEARWRLLAGSGVDVLACETIPSAPEVRALLELLGETPGGWGWMSLQCRDEAHLADGTPLEEVASLCAEATGVAAVGVNCVSPALVAPLIAGLRAAGVRTVAVYPNSGERYHPVSKTWGPGDAGSGLGTAVRDWLAAGASVVGGCCRVLPGEIRQVRAAVLGPGPGRP